MYDPKNVFTAHGMEEYRAHLQNIKSGLFYIINNADDLHIENSERGDKLMQLVYALKEEMRDNFLLEGDGETDED